MDTQDVLMTVAIVALVIALLTMAWGVRTANLRAIEARREAGIAGTQARTALEKVRLLESEMKGGFVTPVLRDPTPFEAGVSLLERRGWEVIQRDDRNEEATLVLRAMTEAGETEPVWKARVASGFWAVISDRYGAQGGLRDAEDVLLTVEKLERIHAT